MLNPSPQTSSLRRTGRNRKSESKTGEDDGSSRPSTGAAQSRRPRSAAPRGRRDFYTATKPGGLFSSTPYDSAPLDVEGEHRRARGMLREIGAGTRPASAGPGRRRAGSGTYGGSTLGRGRGDRLFPALAGSGAGNGSGRAPIHERVEEAVRTTRMRHRTGFAPGSSVGRVSPMRHRNAMHWYAGPRSSSSTKRSWSSVVFRGVTSAASWLLSNPPCSYSPVSPPHHYSPLALHLQTFDPARKLMLGGSGGMDDRDAARRPASASPYARGRYGTYEAGAEDGMDMGTNGTRTAATGQGTRRIREQRRSAGLLGTFPAHASEPYVDGYRIHTPQNKGSTRLLTYRAHTRAARAGLSAGGKARHGW